MILIDLASFQLDSHFWCAVIGSVRERPAMIALSLDKVFEGIKGFVDGDRPRRKQRVERTTTTRDLHSVSRGVKAHSHVENNTAHAQTRREDLGGREGGKEDKRERSEGGDSR
jgi:hypothetical protein